MILEFEERDAFGNVEIIKNQLYSRTSVKKFVRSYKVNRDAGVELIYGCRYNKCNGRGWYEMIKPNGLKEIYSCECVDLNINKINK